MTRSRTRRGPKPRPCCDAARFHVSFHDKHFTGVRQYSLSVRPTAALVCRRDGGEGKRYLQPPKKRVTCVIFSSLPSSSGSLALAASNRAENGTKLTAVASSSRSHSHLRFRLDPLCTPLFVLLSGNNCSLLCFILQKKGPSLVSLPAPRFCC